MEEKAATAKVTGVPAAAGMRHMGEPESVGTRERPKWGHFLVPREAGAGTWGERL